MLMVVTGLILDSVSRGRAEQKRIFYLSDAVGPRSNGANARARPPKAAPGKTPRAA